MSEKLTGKHLKMYFQSSSKENHKIFVESNFDDSLADNIIGYFGDEDIEFIHECVDLYMQRAKGAGVSLSDFVSRLVDVKHSVKTMKDDRKRIQDIMLRTKEMMEGME